MRSGEGRGRRVLAALPVIVLAWSAVGAAPASPAGPAAQLPVRVATTPLTTPPSVAPVEPRAVTATPKPLFAQLAPLAPFGPWRRLPAPVAPGQGPTGNLPPRETPGKQEPAPVRVPVTPPQPVVHRVHLPTSVVLHALDAGQAAFRACWVRAHRQDAAPSSGKIQLHVEVDAGGKVTAAHSDTDAAPLDHCLCNVAAHLPFPARGEPASAELSLLFPVGD